MWKKPLGTLVLLSLSACAAADKGLSPVAGADTITVSVGPCFGQCPIYDFAISSNGHVQFRSWNFEGPPNPKSRWVGADRYEAVASALAAYRPPASLPDCSESWTDAQTIDIVWTDRSGRAATLSHYTGDTCPDSEALSQVIETLPDLAGVSQWIKEPS